MSRSYRKNFVFSVTTSKSEAKDKKIWHKRWRTIERTILKSRDHEVAADMLPKKSEAVVDEWTMDKDGHTPYQSEKQIKAKVKEYAKEKAQKQGMKKKAREKLEKRILHSFKSK